MHRVQVARGLIWLSHNHQDSVGRLALLQQAEEALLQSKGLARSSRAEQKATLFGRDGSFLRRG